MPPHPDPEFDPNTIILGPNRAKEIGFIDADVARAIGVEPGGIRLLNGLPDGRRGGGWGWRHLTSRQDRVRAITGLGFATCQAFVFEVAANWTEIHDAVEPGRIKLVWPRGGLELSIVLQWTGEFWTVTTALPFRPAGHRQLYAKPTPTGATNAEAIVEV